MKSHLITAAVVLSLTSAAQAFFTPDRQSLAVRPRTLGIFVLHGFDFAPNGELICGAQIIWRPGHPEVINVAPTYSYPADNTFGQPAQCWGEKERAASMLANSGANLSE
jgi:hypothetical protein